jgi:pilus assembly protein CpaF
MASIDHDVLVAMNLRINDELGLLPPTDPTTLPSLDAQNSDGDTAIRRLVSRVCGQAEPVLRKRMEDEYFHAGPLEELFTDSQVTEIIVNGGDSIWYERAGRLNRHSDVFLSDLTYRNFISRMSREAGIQASLDCPFADGKWRDCRVHLIIPPASGDQTVLTLRRHPPSPWTLTTLVDRQWASDTAIEALKTLVTMKQNFLIVGGTGSGKTSVLNACLNELQPNERTVIIEDTCELNNPNNISTKLLTRRDSNGLLRVIDQSELLRQTLRMRPDRIIMGEIRGGEAKDLLMAFATGHSGCIGTLHADSARQALLRLEMLIQLGAPQWSLQAVRTLIWLSLHAIVVVGRTKDGNRRLNGIYRIASLEEVGFLIERTI